MKATYNFVLNENEVVISASVSSPSEVHRPKKTRLRATGKSQYIMATNVFRSMADAMRKPLRVMEDEKQETKNPSNNVLVDSPTVVERTETSTARTKVFSQPWASLPLPVAPVKRVRPKQDKGYFSVYKKKMKDARVDENMALNMEQEALKMERSVGPATVDMSEEPLSSAATYSPMRVDSNQSVTDLIQTEKDDVDAEVLPIQSSESPTTNFTTVTHSPMRVDADQSVTALIQNHKDDVNAEVSPIQSSESPSTNFDISDSPIPSQVSPIRFKGRKPANRQMLFVDDVTELTKTNQLTSGHINSAQSILKLHHLDIGGLFCCTMGSLLQFPQAEGDKWVQIVHNGSNH
ncbi:Uncharacterized protein APZ42_005286 [Daphnia magna]|uniref:Uncharacterized protein n=1 Tax=Daphnia magna TaxID=35525 RepID=A0A164GJ81_9CRUS|nr:Uncharacterized protein APZ42_005286 [Daphnia magna]